jgi:AcrR family transcriptional regulator
LSTSARAVAGRAGLPHGTVSYHFGGKQKLLTEAALRTVEQAFPIAELEALQTFSDLIAFAGARLQRDAIDRVASAVMLEAMRESARDDALRERIAGWRADTGGCSPGWSELSRVTAR